METRFEPDGDCLVEIPVRLSLAEAERITRIVDRARRTGMASSAPEPDRAPDTASLAAFARFLLTLRRRRDAAFPTIEFGEPAWDMLLDLYVQHVEGRKVSVSSLCAAASVPATTALRWIEVMVRHGHFTRSPDPDDRRRVHVALSPATIDGIEVFLADTRQRAMTDLR
ncbi:MarR family winged helix-turn-helix transcriptional regulator [Sphingomonas oryzagri]|uniref:MarR family winged helix-turn-helix transcriptional regulator n=1 Tax=Sphingomonas oryzagri TaxID=3042314 RepID=A0ABT6N1U9_9SPHN|nr:MarR family winged helix-turn-helix transcriptional regulator [Sphingomonas oryzagri]MDH7639230.1 MarR family winged helix-turn-helix transcriptional regulator [Sphingomonas oryzagri]